MNTKENIKQIFQNQKKNIYYWVGFILLIVIGISLYQSAQFAQTGQCRNYMYFGSVLHNCSLFEFVKYGWGWMSFTTIFIFTPAASLMVIATWAVDTVFAKSKD